MNNVELNIIDIDGYKVCVSKYLETEEYVMFLANRKGGPIIGNTDYNICLEKFKEALLLFNSMMKLINFCEIMKPGYIPGEYIGE